MISKHKKVSRKTALFLDRDGVINVDSGYVFRPEEFIIFEDAIKLIKFSASKNIPIFIVTNQSGIGRGFYSFEDYQKLNNIFLSNFNDFERKKISISCCPHSPNIGCYCRKPKSYMFKKIIRKNLINVSNSYMVGDKVTDILAAWRVKVNYLFYINRESNYLSIKKLSSELQNNVEKINSLQHIINHIKKRI